MYTVEETAKNNLCISCGLCGAVCPKQCISYEKYGGLYLPVISEKCIKCGKCFSICPGKGFDYTKKGTNDFWLGEYSTIISAKTKNTRMLMNAVSGGVVTELSRCMLDSGYYSSAFLLEGHNYENTVKTKRFIKGQNLAASQKSRYLPVSQEDAGKYMLEHKNEKIILVGTSCFVQGIMNIIDIFQLNRDNYFIIGLFCDKTMTMNIIQYFKRHPCCKKEVKHIYFRTKETGGWPGGVRFEYSDGTYSNLPNTERMKVKEYFQPERCLYCIDKLNKYADISVGDNYTGSAQDQYGSCSVIVRTGRGMDIWTKFQDAFQISPSDYQSVFESQHIADRIINLKFSEIKEEVINWKINILNPEDTIDMYGISFKILKQYKKRIKKIKAGMNFSKKPGQIKYMFLKEKGGYFLRKIYKIVKQ